jgi:DNA-binding NtrC family response regulator
MAATDILLVDDAKDSCTSLTDAVFSLDPQVSRTYGGPAARETCQLFTSGIVLFDYRSPGTDGFGRNGPLQQVQRGTAVVWATRSAAEASGRAATPADIRQVIAHRGE